MKRIVGNTFFHDRTFTQVGDLVMLARLVALIGTDELPAAAFQSC